jgi:hypothetical protein
MSEEPKMAQFDTGATRNKDDNKFDYDGFLSPRVIERYGQYMHSHRSQKDGTMRASDNWQLGIPIVRYMKSLWRHFFDVWKLHRGLTATDPDSGKAVDLETALCGVIFNASGMLHETLKAKASLPIQPFDLYPTFSDLVGQGAHADVIGTKKTKGRSLLDETLIKHLKNGTAVVRHTWNKKSKKGKK